MMIFQQLTNKIDERIPQINERRRLPPLFSTLRECLRTKKLGIKAVKWGRGEGVFCYSAGEEVITPLVLRNRTIEKDGSALGSRVSMPTQMLEDLICSTIVVFNIRSHFTGKDYPDYVVRIRNGRKISRFL